LIRLAGLPESNLVSGASTRSCCRTKIDQVQQNLSAQLQPPQLIIGFN
jgi:hypothetical protein